MTQTGKSSDAIVVGAGVIGASVALHLARRGMEVELLDRDASSDGPGTSGRSFGLVWAQSKAPNTYLQLSLASVGYYPEFLASLGDDCGYERPGGLIPIETEEQLGKLRTLMGSQSRTPGFSVRFLDAHGLRELEPAFSEHLLGATFSPHDGHLEPERLVAALRRAAQAAGVRLQSGAAVRSVRRQRDGWEVETTAGTWTARTLVNSAGVWSPEIAQMMGLVLPVEAVRGQIVVSAPQPRFMAHPSPDVRQAADGRVWMGTIHQHGDRDIRPRAEDTDAVLEIAARQVPRLSGVKVDRVFAGIRGIPTDGHPILGAVEEAAYVAVGHSGITLSPIVGKLMAELIVSKQVPLLLRAFAPDRPSLTTAPVHAV